jgi:hypothetical protein
MKTFEDELLTELKTVVAERTPAKRGGRRRVAVGLAAAVTLAAGTAIAVPLIGGDKTATSAAAAYTVTATSTGAFELTLNPTQTAEDLQRALEKTGLKAEVKFLKTGEYCRRRPAGQSSTPSHILIRQWFLHNLSSKGAKVDPAPYRGWTIIVEASGKHGVIDPTDPKPGLTLNLGTRAPLAIDFLRTGSFGPCVVSR